MALYGSFQIADALDEAFERLNLDPSSISGRHITSARRSIRLLLTAWNNDGVLFWKVLGQQQQVMTQGDPTFTPVAGCIDILDASLLRDDVETPLGIMSRTEYFAIPDKTQEGMPNRIWVERLASGPVAHLYFVPENSTDIVVYDAIMQFNDSSELAGSADVPFHWQEAFTAGLTAKLAEKFKPELFDAKRRLAGGPEPELRGMGAYALAKMGDRERGDTVMTIGRRR